MIAFLRGTVAEALPQCLVLDVHGVGYEVQVPLSTFDALNPVVGQPVTLKTHVHFRENGQTLYGFATDAERDIFRLLIDRVSGIGPATAVSILSGLNVNAFKSAVVSGDVQAIARAKGVGKRTAERIILELKDKVAKENPVMKMPAGARPAGVQAGPGAKLTDASSALAVLGYSQAEITAALRTMDVDAMSVEEIIRAVLQGSLK